MEDGLLVAVKQRVDTTSFRTARRTRREGRSELSDDPLRQENMFSCRMSGS